MWGNGPYQGMMGYGDGWGWMPFHGLFSLLFLILIVVAVVVLIRVLWGAGDRRLPHDRRSPGFDILEERYARGDIARDEYLQKKRDIGGRSGTG